MNDRIRLAEAMGRKRHEWRFDSCGAGQGGLHVCKHCDRSYCSPPWTRSKLAETEIFCDDSPIPDPFTDANDDYAVLEWVRASGSDAMRKSVSSALCKNNSRRTALWQYRIGDYARAALKVLDTDR